MVRATVAPVIGLLGRGCGVGRQVTDNGAIGRNQPSTANLMGFLVFLSFVFYQRPDRLSIQHTTAWSRQDINSSHDSFFLELVTFKRGCGNVSFLGALAFLLGVY